jgi:transmembrane sensor
MTQENSDVMNTARLWMIRVNEPGFENWDVFTSWLEADRRHLEAYEAALAEDEWLAHLARGNTVPAWSRPKANADGAASRLRSLFARWPRQAFGGLIAASLAIVMVAVVVMNQGPGMTEIVTSPGQHRTIAMEDGSRIVVNGDSSLSYNPDEPRFVSLDRGEALFEVRHDETNPFVVQAGATRLVDAGTVFNVVSDAGALEVAVAEGAVIYNPEREKIRLNPGDALTRPGPDAPVEVRRIDVTGIGGWHEGILQFQDAPLSAIVRDLARAVGKPIRLADGAARIRYTGTLAVGGSAEEVRVQIAPLLGVTIIEEADGWVMKPANAASR